MPGKEPRVLCPVCQEPLPPDETECRNCGAFVVDEALVRLSRAFGIDRTKALQLFEVGFRHPLQLQGRDVDRVLERGESGLLFLCTNCGSFVAGQEARCARCGSVFEASPDESIDIGEEDDILDVVLCRNCGADNDPEIVECEICGEQLKETPVVPKGTVAPAKPAAPEASPKAEEDLGDFDALARELEAFDERAAPTEASVPAGGKPSEPTDPSNRIVKRAADIRFRRRKPRARRRDRGRLWIPRNMVGAAVAAAAAGALAAKAFGQPGVLWGIAALLAALVAYALVLAFPFNALRRELREAIPLAAGTALASLAPAVAVSGGPESTSLALSLGSAIPLVWVTRHLWRRPDRTVLAAAGGAPLLALAFIGASGHPYVGSVAWTIAVIATAPWPSVLVFNEMRRHWFSHAVGKTVERAEGAYVRRDYERSVEEFDHAIRLAAEASARVDLPWYGKGAALTILGRYEEALRSIDRALDINPMNEVAWVNKGNALTRMGRLVDALRSFNAAIKLNPVYEVAWNNKGNALARLGQYEEALRCYEKALDLDPAYRGAWVNKGFVLAKLGRFDDAAACADRALDLAGVRPAGSA